MQSEYQRSFENMRQHTQIWLFTQRDRRVGGDCLSQAGVNARQKHLANAQFWAQKKRVRRPAFCYSW